MTRPARRPAWGFTLIEVLVGLAIMALLALMSWRGLEGLLGSQARLRERGVALASLQTALAQWTMDLQQSAENPYLNAIAWDGQRLRIVRRSVSDNALVVVAWGARRLGEGGVLQWRRWQSPPVRDRAALLKAWGEAATRLNEDSLAAGSGAGAVTLVPIVGWQLLMHQGAGWAPAPALSAAAASATDPQLQEPPTGVRLRLELPGEAGLSGPLQLDWVNPSQNRGRS